MKSNEIHIHFDGGPDSRIGSKMIRLMLITTSRINHSFVIEVKNRTKATREVENMITVVIKYGYEPIPSIENNNTPNAAKNKQENTIRSKINATSP